MKHKKHLIACLLCYLLLGNLHTLIADDFWKTPKFGTVSNAEWELNSYDKDPSANAIILFDIGSVYFDSEGNIVFERHKRIKVLNRSAFDMVADVSFRARQSERLVFDAATITRDASGNVSKNKVDKKQIFDIDLPDGYRQRKFTYPALSEGCILDLKYEVYTSVVFLKNWYFQDSDMPTIHSEYKIQIPDSWDYTTFYHGQHPLSSQTNERKDITFLIGSHNYTFHGSLYTWIMHDSPKFEAEKYISSELDYIDQITGKLTSYIPLGGTDKHDVIKDWVTIKKDYMESDGFGKKIDASSYFKKVLENNPSLTKGDPLQKARAIYAFVQKEVTWNGYYNEYTSATKLSSVFEKHTGMSGEINLILLNLLRSAGLNATPILTSTRQNGTIERRYPSSQQFNHALVLLNLPDADYFLDATHENVPFGMLHTSALNRHALLMNNNQTDEWVHTAVRVGYQNNEKISAKIEPDGTLQGSMRLTDYGYSAYQKREKARKMETKKFIESYYQKILPDIAIDSFQLKNLDNDSLPFTTILHFKIPNYAQVSGNNIYFNPNIFQPSKDNPFSATERNCPIDFGATFDFQTTLNIKIPEGYHLEGANSDNTLITPDSTAYHQRKIVHDGNNIQILDRLKINQSEYPVESYAHLRRLFEAAYADNTLILKK